MRHLIRRYLIPGMMATSCSLAIAFPASAQSGDLGIRGDVLVERVDGEGDYRERRNALPKFWIGIQGDRIDETIRSQLGLDHGIDVRGVIEGSPAAKAGVKTNDILLSVNEKPLHEVSDLFEPVGQSEGKSITLTLLRAGKKETIEVQPEKRPEDRMPDVQRTDLHVRELRGGPFGFFPQPLRMLFMNAPVAVDTVLPDDVTVTVTKQGKQPPRISVKRGEQTWDLAADQLDQLPADLRPAVEVMVHGGGSVHVQPSNPWVYAPQPNANPNANGDYTIPVPQVLPFPGAQSRIAPQVLQNDIDQLRKEVDSLRQAVEKLSSPESKPHQ